MLFPGAGPGCHFKKSAPALLAISVFLILGCVAVYRLGRASDFDAYWEAGRRLIEASDATGSPTVRRYLPFFTVFILPLALLPMRVAGAVWHTISFLALIGSIRLSLRFLGRDPSLQSRDFIAVTLLTAVFWVAHLVIGQANLVVLYLILLAFDLMMQRRELWGGALIGLAVALKVTPAIFLVYLGIRRRWRAMSGLLIVFCLSCLLTIPVFGLRPARDYHAEWLSKHGATAGTEFLRQEKKKIKYTNISLPAVVGRLSMPVNAGSRARPFRVNIMSLSPEEAGYLTKILQIPFLAWFALLAATVRTTNAVANLAAVGFVLGLVSLLSPIVWTASLVFLIPGCAAMWCSGDRVSRRLLVLYALSLISVVHPATRAIGGLLMANLIVTVGCGRLAWRHRKDESDAAIRLRSRSATFPPDPGRSRSPSGTPQIRLPKVRRSGL